MTFPVFNRAVLYSICCFIMSGLAFGMSLFVLSCVVLSGDNRCPIMLYPAILNVAELFGQTAHDRRTIVHRRYCVSRALIHYRFNRTHHACRT